MTLTEFRSLLTWHLFIGAVAFVAYWTYCQTVDPIGASTFTSASIDTNGTIAGAWIADKQDWFQSHWNTFSTTRDQVYTGLTTGQEVSR